MRPEDVLAALPLQDDAADAAPVQKLGQQKSRRAGTDNADLRFHARTLRGVTRVAFGSRAAKVFRQAGPRPTIRTIHFRNPSAGSTLRLDGGSMPATPEL